MIPLEKEAQIHKMLLAGTPQRDVSEAMGVSPSTVVRISRAIRLASEIDDRRRKRTRLLLIGGLSPESISAKLSIPIDAVWAIKRADFLMASVVESPRPCPTCGSIMLPAEEGEEHELTTPPPRIAGWYTRDLFVLADEIVGLAKAHTVCNLLFYNIADRAERLIAAIIGEENDEGKEKR